jgi:drug/metabolite transporter (DMT)-like permease
MCCVGSSVAVSTTIIDAPLFTLQGLRYALAAIVLLVLARATGRSLPRPRGRDWPWLGGVAATGLVLFNVGIVRGSLTRSRP